MRDELTIIPVERIEEILLATFNQNIPIPHRLNGMNREKPQQPRNLTRAYRTLVAATLHFCLSPLVYCCFLLAIGVGD